MIKLVTESLNDYLNPSEQTEYNDWVSNTSIKSQIYSCGGTHISETESYIINKYAKHSILDIGCGTGIRTFPFYVQNDLSFLGIEKFPNLINDSPYKNDIIQGDITLSNFKNIVDPNSYYDLTVMFGEILSSFLDSNLRNQAFKNISYITQNISDFIVVDAMSHFDWFYEAEEGQIIKLFKDLPPQYFYSQKELYNLFNKYNLKIVEEKTQLLQTENFEKTYFILKTN